LAKATLLPEKFAHQIVSAAKAEAEMAKTSAKARSTVVPTRMPIDFTPGTLGASAHQTLIASGRRL
jgi:predicted Zn-dependent protease